MTKEIDRTEGIGQGWDIDLWTDGSVTIRNSEKGLEETFSPEEADRLAAILKAHPTKAEALKALGAS